MSREGGQRWSPSLSLALPPTLLPPSCLPPPTPIQREDEDILSLSSSLWTVFARWVMVMRGGGWS